MIKLNLFWYGGRTRKGLVQYNGHTVPSECLDAVNRTQADRITFFARTVHDLDYEQVIGFQNILGKTNVGLCVFVEHNIEAEMDDILMKCRHYNCFFERIVFNIEHPDIFLYSTRRDLKDLILSLRARNFDIYRSNKKVSEDLQIDFCVPAYPSKRMEESIHEIIYETLPNSRLYLHPRIIPMLYTDLKNATRSLGKLSNPKAVQRWCDYSRKTQLFSNELDQDRMSIAFMWHGLRYPMVRSWEKNALDFAQDMLSLDKDRSEVEVMVWHEKHVRENTQHWDTFINTLKGISE